MVEEIKGNLLDTDCRIITHGVNCQGKMESSVAKALYTKYPEVKESYLNFFNDEYNSEEYLGLVNCVYRDDKIVLNCFIQQNYGHNKQIYISYKAITKCFSIISCFYDEIAIPRIGCGLAGGDWKIVKKCIEDVVGDECLVKMYYLE